ncbi:MAG: rRNA maturation RNase YbeY [Proteobacteria bacterium]|nr:rRNA maturation RNase YbeY [Pseudomonadota bacterium]
MRAVQCFEYIRDGRVAGRLDVQDTGDFAAVEGLLAACQQAAAVVDERVAQYHSQTLPWVVSIRLGGVEEGRAMNRDFRGKDYATNVLSFGHDGPLEEGFEEDEAYVGDIFICMPVIIAEAAEQGKSVADHLRHMVVHGMLHLVGYDHENPTMAKAMETLEIEILASLKVANPYADMA